MLQTTDPERPSNKENPSVMYESPCEEEMEYTLWVDEVTERMRIGGIRLGEGGRTKHLEKQVGFGMGNLREERET